MIFVTVGTHEQPFNRLIKEIDRLVCDGVINDKVFMQTGYSTYRPQNCRYSSFLSYQDMDKYMKESDIVISHGGPATFMHAISLGKKVIVVPRLKKFQEHINDHQLIFCKEVEKKGYDLNLLIDIHELYYVLCNLEQQTQISAKSNNATFVKSLKQHIYKIV